MYRLYLANIKSWNSRYNENVQPLEESSFKAILYNSKESYKSIYHLLKALHCLNYNIELPKEKETEFKDDIEIIEAVIKAIESYIIHEIPEYKEVRYGLI
jgi:hypothetical protein